MVSGITDLTVALVPTGMNAGVAICPCAVVIVPARALLFDSGLLKISKEKPVLDSGTINYRPSRWFAIFFAALPKA